MEFSRAEKGAILDVLNGTILDESTQDLNLVDAFAGGALAPGLAGQIAHEVADALEDGLAEKWEIDGAALVAKLNTLDKPQGLALKRAIEAWWNRVSSGEQPDFGELKW